MVDYYLQFIGVILTKLVMLLKQSQLMTIDVNVRHPSYFLIAELSRTISCFNSHGIAYLSF